MEDYPVRLVNLPVSVHSFVREKDGVTTIVLNARLTMEQLRKCYKHEVEHILARDLESCGSADVIEMDRHDGK